MSAFGVGRRWLDLTRAGRLAPERMRALQNAKLRDLAAHAYATVPFYRQRFDAAGLRPADIRTVDDLVLLPVVTRAELQAQPPQALLSAAYPSQSLETTRTTGSTGRPLEIHRDPAFRQTRSALFLRALAAAGYWPGQRLLILAGMRRGTAAGWMRWHYRWRDADPEELVQALQEVRPRALYGPVTVVRRLTDVLVARASIMRLPDRVFTTAESLDAATRAHVTATLRAEVFEIYGSTELGTVAWECRAHAGLHLAEETTVLELVPATPDGACRIVATSLDMRAMPLLRYDTGDLARPADGACSCGSGLRRIARIEGRLVDCVRLADGRSLSPYLFTERLEGIPGIERYQLVQEDFARFRLRVLGQDVLGAAIREAASSVVRDLVGSATVVEVSFERTLDPPAGRKFRVVECRVGTEAGA